MVLRDYQSVVWSLLTSIYKETEKKYLARDGIARFMWEHLLKKRQMNVLCKKYSQPYLKIWIAYNESILRHLQGLPVNNYIIAEQAGMYKNDRSVFRHLTDVWGFALSFCNFKSLYKEIAQQKSINIDAYVKDASLISRAKQLEHELRQLSAFNNRSHALVAV